MMRQTTREDLGMDDDPPDDDDDLTQAQIKQQAIQLVLDHLARGIELWQAMDQPGAGLWSDTATDAVHAQANQIIKELAEAVRGGRPTGCEAAGP